MSLPWPGFWGEVPEEDREPLRAALNRLLSHGAILGDEGGGRELYQLVRDRYRKQVAEHLAPFGLAVVVHPEPFLIIQAEPQPGECKLLASFDQQETLLALVLWRMYDEALAGPPGGAVTFTLNAIWTKWRVYFPAVEAPTPHGLDEALTTLKRKCFVRQVGTADPQKAGDTRIEVLPTLTRAIGFADAADWQNFVSTDLAPGA